MGSVEQSVAKSARYLALTRSYAEEYCGMRKCNLAEREGFEPPVPLRVLRISSATRSTTLPPLRSRERHYGEPGL